MAGQLHFISGLPRSGSTLLSAILAQNPKFRAGMSGPLGALFGALQREMSQHNEFAVFIDDSHRERVLRGVFETYYELGSGGYVVFDTNRLWCAKLHTLATLFPDSRVICCVRHVPWVLDSIERLIRRNRFELSKIFDFDAGGTVYSRVDGLSSGNGMVGFAWNALKQAFYSDEADRIMLLTYETLTTEPWRAVAEVYSFVGETPFAHDFQNIAFDASEFDRRLGTPGLHAVGRQVRAQERQTVLPPDLFRRFEPDSFWRDPALNLRGVKIV